MDIADIDESGTIDKAEFSEFILKLDATLEADKITEIFDAEDEDADGELSIEEFGKAIFAGVKDMKIEADAEDAE